MHSALDLVLVITLLTNLNLLASSRLRNCIKLVGAQGLLVGTLPLLAPTVVENAALGMVYVGAGVLLRGLVFPWLLLRAVREANVSRELEPYVGYSSSLLFGAAALLFSAWVSSRLPLPEPAPSPLVMTVALFTGLTGLFLSISRKKAVSQVLGYLILENGIFVFGVMLVHHQPLLVEFGVLLDVFAALFVMGITMFHISREFDHIDADRLASLKD